MAKTSGGKPVVLALLRGINVGGNKKVSMDVLRGLAEKAGFTSVKTYINSGNLLFRTDVDAAKVEATLEKAIEKQFGFSVDVVVRTAEQWAAYAKKSGFPDGAANLVHLVVAKQPLGKGVAAALTAIAKDGERIKALPDALWIDFAEGAGRSKLTTSALDKHAGCPMTARNWNTVVKLNELASTLE